MRPSLLACRFGKPDAASARADRTDADRATRHRRPPQLPSRPARTCRRRLRRTPPPLEWRRRRAGAISYAGFGPAQFGATQRRSAQAWGKDMVGGPGDPDGCYYLYPQPKARKQLSHSPS